MRTLSVEWARFDIRLLALAAGQFETQTLLTKYPQAIVERIAHTIPLGRMGTEREFAWLVAFLASPAGDFFSGAVITMDGARDDWLGPWPPAQAADAEGTPLSEAEARLKHKETHAPHIPPFSDTGIVSGSRALRDRSRRGAAT